MSDKKDTNDLREAGDSTESAEYEDDFEKDLEWFINEEKEDDDDPGETEVFDQENANYFTIDLQIFNNLNPTYDQCKV